MTRLISIQEASNMLKLSIPTLYKMSCQKRIPVVKLGSRLLFSEENLQKWIEKNSYDPISKKGKVKY